MPTAFIVFPHQLFKEFAPLQECKAFLVEEFLFFRQFRFHKQKLVFHRASLKAYESRLRSQGIETSYIPAFDEQADIRSLLPALRQSGFQRIRTYEPSDEWLRKRLIKTCGQEGLYLEFIPDPSFINTERELAAFQDGRKKYFQTDFYIQQRKARNILVERNGEPLQGKWSFDTENRCSYPKEKRPPSVRPVMVTDHHREALQYVEKHFPDNPGLPDPSFYYPIDHQQAEEALKDFFIHRFPDFGIYEDAIVKQEHHLHHSILSPLINAGLLLPDQVISKAIEFATKNGIPFNSLEGFVRQILGWREFIRMVYLREGNRQRTRNYWNFKRKIPASFYDGSTGIDPVDKAIKKLLPSAYNHHIERLMILSNFMLLCEFDPDEVYRWFMEMYIDAYDWVMVPNIYGMGQFADGGLMCTKPYISGSNYILKMSDHKKGEDWCATWDALFWRFMHVHRSFFLNNPRLGMLVRTFDKWDANKQKQVLDRAETFLAGLDKN